MQGNAAARDVRKHVSNQSNQNEGAAAAAWAVAYCRRGWPIFPCHWSGDRRKTPLVERGFHVATTDEEQVQEWLRRWPRALIGTPTGRAGAGPVVLDIDIKRANANGFDTLADIGHAVLPETPMVHTESGGLHVYFDPGEREIRNSAGNRGRGIGPGLDVRGDGGYVILPSPGSGYHWDPIWHADSVPLALTPDWLIAPQPERHQCASRPVAAADGLSPYAGAALDKACRRIIDAPPGEQEATLNAQAFAIGTLAAAKGIPTGFARRALLWAAHQVHDYDCRRPWRSGELERKIDRAFSDGLRQPREMCRG
jgi:hypothetical protein